MPQRYRTPNLQPIQRATKAIRSVQRQDAHLLKDAAIGRGITHLPGETLVNEGIAKERATYARLGHIGLIYIFPKEFRENRGVTFHNSVQVRMAIDKLGIFGASSLLVGRSELDIIEKRSEPRPNQPKTFWVRAIAGRAQYEDATVGQRANLAHEELTISNALLEEEMNVTGPPQLWLGALTAPSVEAAQDALEIMEDILPAQIHAGPVRILSPRNLPANSGETRHRR